MAINDAIVDENSDLLFMSVDEDISNQETPDVMPLPLVTPPMRSIQISVPPLSTLSSGMILCDKELIEDSDAKAIEKAIDNEFLRGVEHNDKDEGYPFGWAVLRLRLGSRRPIYSRIPMKRRSSDGLTRSSIDITNTETCQDLREHSPVWAYQLYCPTESMLEVQKPVLRTHLQDPRTSTANTRARIPHLDPPPVPGPGNRDR